MTLLITVLGIVQGVGYRPFAARLAKEMGITGSVRNSGGIVHIEARGEESKLAAFSEALSSRCPPGAVVTEVLTERIPDTGRFEDFRIIPSGGNTEHTPILPPDLPVCPACLDELRDPRNRRHAYPFISCVDCGPRYSIIRKIPYDRDTITMDAFPMCPTCEKEYTGDDRRRHAQTISCRDCGPQLILSTGDAVIEKDAALSAAVGILRQGGVLAVKGIGGYQLACRPDSADTVRALRILKKRDSKPFAVMFPDIGTVRGMCRVSPGEERLLLSAARPIVLLKPEKMPFVPDVNAGSRFQGAFLPYTGLHQMLTDSCGPLIMTSANLSEDPILFRDSDIFEVTSPYLSGILWHTREIVTPLDDSVARITAGRTQMIRRSRGYVPLPVSVEQPASHTVLALGGDLKGAFCLAKEGRAYLSQYFGDMENYAVRKNYIENVSRMEELFHMDPDMIACDMHPMYATSDLARKWNEGSGEKDRKLVRIQHHHAHIASVMAEHRLDSCIGVAFDGTGYGTDGAIWGSEFLLCRGAAFERKAHLSYIRLAGGDSAAKDASLAAFCYLEAAGMAPDHPEGALLRAALSDGNLSVRTSSMGRLFDAVSAVLGIRNRNTYEGECAIALENAAAEALASGIPPYPLHFPAAHDMDESTGDSGSESDPSAVLKEIFLAAKAGADARALALGFHQAVVRMAVSHCVRIREESGENRVALSGGVFANVLLAEACIAALGRNGFDVYMNEAVPANDGGISLGQAWLCGRDSN